MKELADGRIELVDPWDSTSKVFASYAEVREELLQDEFHRVEGREELI